MSYALFFHDIQISEVFPTKADAWAFAEKCGHVTVVPAHDEDPPRRILSLSHSIRQAETNPRFKLPDNEKHQQLSSRT